MSRTVVVVAALVFCTGAFASAACDKAEYGGFANRAKFARRSLVKAPARALSAFETLDSRAQACRRVDKRADAQYKLLLFHTGLLGYIGAARAELGEVKAGGAMVAQAERDAQQILKAHQYNQGQRSLAQALIEQLTVPQDILGRLRKK